MADNTNQGRISDEEYRERLERQAEKGADKQVAIGRLEHHLDEASRHLADIEDNRVIDDEFAERAEFIAGMVETLRDEDFRRLKTNVADNTNRAREELRRIRSRD